MSTTPTRLLPTLAALLLCAPLLVAIAGLAGAWLTPAAEVWAHLRAHVLPAAFADTLTLLVIVGFGCATIGTAGAWLNTRCDYPGRRMFDWALLLPLALPSYVVAFVAIGLLDYAGPVQTLWRDLSGSRATLFSPNGVGWAAAVLTLCFYPYVYLTIRAALLRQGDRHVDVARTLGLSRLRAFWHARLPLLRPALMAGLGLVLLETLAEFGAVSLLGVDTLTTAVYKTWFGMYSLPAAAQLASLGLALAALLLYMEWRARARQRRHDATAVAPSRHRLGRGMATLAILAQSALLLVAFVIPVVQLAWWASKRSGRGAADLAAFQNTLLLGAMAAVLLVAMGLLLAALRRTSTNLPVQAATSLSTLGYGVPGTVLAAGLLLGLLALESSLASIGIELALTGSIAVLLLALHVRFLRAAALPIAASVEQMKPSQFEVARTLGASRRIVWRTVVLPALRPGVLAALLLVAIEVMKEMPATLMLRPLGWDTLAVRIHALTSEGLWHEAAMPALALVAAGLLPIWWLVRLQERRESRVPI